MAAVRFGALDRYELFNKDVGLLLPFLSYIAITSSIAEWDDLRHILRVFAASVVLQNIVAVGGYLLAYFYGLANPFARYGGRRLSGVLLDPNAYGGLLVAALVICEGAIVRTGASLQETNALALQTDSGAGHSVHLLPLRLGGPRRGSAAPLFDPNQSRDSACGSSADRRALLASIHGEPIRAHLRSDGQSAETGPGQVRFDP